MIADFAASHGEQIFELLQSGGENGRYANLFSSTSNSSLLRRFTSVLSTKILLSSIKNILSKDFRRGKLLEKFFPPRQQCSMH